MTGITVYALSYMWRPVTWATRTPL